MAKFEFILCADDYALSPAVSRGILEALEAGRLSATGAMTNRPSWRDAARDLSPHVDRAWLGVHLNLTLGTPLTPMPAFARNGLPGIGTLVRAKAADLPREEIAAEIYAQIDAFAQAMGRMPDFLDGHQHVQALPGIRDSLFSELGRFPLPHEFWLRDSSDHMTRILLRRSALAKAAMVAWLGRGFAPTARRYGFATNEGFAGFSAFDERVDYAGLFSRYLAAPGTRHLIMCHPGYIDAELTAADPVTGTRPQELAFLLSDDFTARTAAVGAVLARPAAR